MGTLTDSAEFALMKKIRDLQGKLAGAEQQVREMRRQMELMGEDLRRELGDLRSYVNDHTHE